MECQRYIIGCMCLNVWLRVCAFKSLKASSASLSRTLLIAENITCVRPARFRLSKLVLVLLDLGLRAGPVQTCPITKRYVCAAKSFDPLKSGVVVRFLRTL